MGAELAGATGAVETEAEGGDVVGVPPDGAACWVAVVATLVDGDWPLLAVRAAIEQPDAARPTSNASASHRVVPITIPPVVCLTCRA